MEFSQRKIPFWQQKEYIMPEDLKGFRLLILQEVKPKMNLKMDGQQL